MTLQKYDKKNPLFPITNKHCRDTVHSLLYFIALKKKRIRLQSVP